MCCYIPSSLSLDFTKYCYYYMTLHMVRGNQRELVFMASLLGFSHRNEPPFSTNSVEALETFPILVNQLENSTRAREHS